MLTEGDHGQVASLEVTLKTLTDLGSVSGVFEVVEDGLALLVDAFCCWSTRLAIRVHLDLVFSHYKFVVCMSVFVVLVEAREMVSVCVCVCLCEWMRECV